jgi:RNA polymerase sigma-70 factor (ECF subfamily)
MELFGTRQHTQTTTLRTFSAAQLFMLACFVISCRSVFRPHLIQRKNRLKVAKNFTKVFGTPRLSITPVIEAKEFLRSLDHFLCSQADADREDMRRQSMNDTNMDSKSAETDNKESATSQVGWFTTTHWSLVLNARDPDSPQATEALEKLCRSYWYPMYAYVRSRGIDQASAKDLTQGFFARLLEKNYLAQVQREKGLFRSFLLASLKHFLSDEWDKSRAQKRGGGQTHISLDDTTGEDRYRLEPVDHMDAEKLFERRWAMTVLEQAQGKLAEEYAKAGKSELYTHLRAVESGENGPLPLAEVAVALGLTESAVKSAAFRMRQRYRELVRGEVANTVGSSTEVDEELRHLIAVISA